MEYTTGTEHGVITREDWGISAEEGTGLVTQVGLPHMTWIRG